MSAQNSPLENHVLRMERALRVDGQRFPGAAWFGTSPNSTAVVLAGKVFQPEERFLPATVTRQGSGFRK